MSNIRKEKCKELGLLVWPAGSWPPGTKEGDWILRKEAERLLGSCRQQ